MKLKIKAGAVAIIGWTNSGKSSLLNYLLKTKIALVSSKPNATRLAVRGYFVDERGQIIFWDSPGIQDLSSKQVADVYKKQIEESIRSTDLVWVLIRAETEENEIKKILAQIQSLKPKKTFLVLSCIDKFKNLEEKNNKIKQIQDRATEFTLKFLDFHLISIKTHEGIHELIQKTFDYLDESDPIFDPDELSDQNSRFFVSEKIRESIFEIFHHEVPYSSVVVIDHFNDEEKILKIEATIYVERDSQKAILIGKNGSSIKNLGISARMKIEDFLGKKIFLGLRVKVSEDWTNNETIVRRFLK